MHSNRKHILSGCGLGYVTVELMGYSHIAMCTVLHGINDVVSKPILVGDIRGSKLLTSL